MSAFSSLQDNHIGKAVFQCLLAITYYTGETDIHHTGKQNSNRQKYPFQTQHSYLIQNTELSWLKTSHDKFPELSIHPEPFKTRSYLLLTDRSHWNPVGWWENFTRGQRALSIFCTFEYPGPKLSRQSPIIERIFWVANLSDGNLFIWYSISKGPFF